jgi:hypothetical protein
LFAYDDKNIPGAGDVMKVARNIFEYFNKSTQASEKLSNQQNQFIPG